jgi:hypothetical protein
MLGDDEAPVRAHLDEREADVFQARDLLEKREVAAGDLGAALDDVSRHQRPRQPVPVVAFPSEVVGGGTHHHGGVGHPARNDDVRLTVQRRDDPPAAEVGVGGHGSHPGFSQRTSVDKGPDLDLIEARHQIVAVDGGNDGIETQLSGQFPQCLGEPGRVEPAGVHDHPDATLEAGPHHLFHLAEESAGIAAIGMLLAVAPQQRHGQFRQVVAGQVVDRAAFDHLAGGVAAVPKEARAVAYTDRFHAGHASRVGTGLVRRPGLGEIPSGPCPPVLP